MNHLSRTKTLNLNMKLVFLSTLFLLTICNNLHSIDGKEHFKFQGKLLNYRMDELKRMYDWDCWYKDYYMKVSHCPSETYKSEQKVGCKQFRGCKRYCESTYGILQCRVRCQLKRRNLSKQVKVVYRVRQDGSCKDSVICVYSSKCKGTWPKYEHQGCYYTSEFYKWWVDHKKEYAIPRLSSKAAMKPIGRNYGCLGNARDSSLVDPTMETVVKIRKSHGRIHHKIGNLWIRVKVLKDKLFYRIGKIWVPVKFAYKHQYLKIGDKWLRTAVIRKQFYVKMNSLWVPLTISFGKEYVKLGERWLRLKIDDGKYYYKFGHEWVEIMIMDNDLYCKIDKRFYKVKIVRVGNLIKIGGKYQKINIINKKRYIKFGSRWFEFEIKLNKYFVKFDRKFIEIEFENKETYLVIQKSRYPILFNSFYIYIQIKGEWVQMEQYYEKMFFKIDKQWIHFSLDEDRFVYHRNSEVLKLTMNKRGQFHYKSHSNGTLKLISKMKMEPGKSFPVNKFYKSEKPLTFKLIGGHWLPHKSSDGKSMYLLSETWVTLKTENEKVFYNDHGQWIEICMIGKTEFNRINGKWIKVKRKNNALFFFISRRWHEIKLHGKQMQLKINDSWKPFAISNWRKFIRLGNKFVRVKFDHVNENKFYLLMGGKWFEFLIQYKQFYILLNKTLQRIEFNSHSSTKILLEEVWLTVTFKNQRFFIRHETCWLETNFQDKKIMLKIGDTFRETKIFSDKLFHVNINGNFYKLHGKNEIEINQKIVKVTYIDGLLQIHLNDNWLPLRIKKDKLLVKVVDSWIEGHMDNESQIIFITVENQKLPLTFENGILCEQYGKYKVPINIRFQKLYYNFDGKWTRVYPKDNLRYVKVDGKQILITNYYLKRKILKYKLTMMRKCIRLSKEQTFGMGKRNRGLESSLSFRLRKKMERYDYSFVKNEHKQLLKVNLLNLQKRKVGKKYLHGNEKRRIK